MLALLKEVGRRFRGGRREGSGVRFFPYLAVRFPVLLKSFLLA